MLTIPFPKKPSYLTKSYISHGIYNPIEMIKRDKLLDKKGGKISQQQQQNDTIDPRAAFLFRCPGSISFTLEWTNAEQQLTELISIESVRRKNKTTFQKMFTFLKSFFTFR